MESTMPPPIWDSSTYSPEELQSLSQAYEMACLKLGLKLREDPVNETVAQRIFHVGRVEKDPQRICEMVISAFERP
jgi:hypothetical protein